MTDYNQVTIRADDGGTSRKVACNSTGQVVVTATSALPVTMSSPTTQSAPFYDLLAAGQVPNDFSLFKYGRGTITTNEDPVWEEGGAYTFPPSPQALTLSSADAGDVGPVVTVTQLLDGSYVQQPDVDVTLQGQSGVPVGTYFRCSRMFLKSGSITGPVYLGYGAISSGKPATVVATFTAVDNQTEQAIYTVPAGYTMLVHNVYYWTETGKVVSCSGRFSVEGGPLRRAGNIITRDGKASYVSAIPVAIPEKSDFF